MKYIIIFVILILTSCSFKSKELSTKNYRIMLNSDKAYEVCIAAFHLGERKDTVSVRDLLSNLADPRITHHLRQKGMSVYYCKAGALRKISGLEIDIKQHELPDSLVIKTFTNWALENELLR